MCGPFFVLPPLQGEGGREATGWGSAKRGAGGAGLAFPTRARLRLAVPPPEGEGERYGMTLRRRCRRSGRVRGGRASPGAYGFYRFDEADRPARPFSTRPPAGGPCFGPYRISAADIAGCDAGGTWRSQQSAPLARGEQAEGHPSTSARTPGVSFPRASALDHSPPTSRRWIRRPPHRRDGQESRTGASYGGLMTLYLLKG
jgi:hypothetical protein